MALIDSGKTFDRDDNHEKMKTRMEHMDVSPYLLRIPAPLHQKVKIKLAKENKKLREVLVDMLEEYIKE